MRNNLKSGHPGFEPRTKFESEKMGHEMGNKNNFRDAYFSNYKMLMFAMSPS